MAIIVLCLPQYGNYIESLSRFAYFCFHVPEIHALPSESHLHVTSPAILQSSGGQDPYHIPCLEHPTNS